MGFLHRIPEIEDWLDDAASSWYALTDRRYMTRMAAWRSAFDPLLRDAARASATSTSLIQARLPFSSLIFTIAGHPGLPTAPQPDRGAPVYAYEAAQLTRLDHDLLNRVDAIVSDVDLRFACIYSHEADWFSRPRYVERGVG